MPNKQLYIDGTNGRVAIVNYSNATPAITNPNANIDDVYFHTDLPYIQLKDTVGPTSITLSAMPRAYYTWSDGGGKGGGCFITKACVDTMQLEDSDRVLATLRYFRDKYMLADIERCKKVAEYYLLGPQIVLGINNQSNTKEIYTRMYTDYILPAVSSIDNMEYEEAMKIYVKGVEYSAKAAGVHLG
jgi:hypothetical protein